MDDATPKDSARSPVEQLARFLMVSAKEDPSLLRRTTASPPPVPFLDRVRDLPAMLYPQLEPEGKSRTDSYLEELVALAIASAREAEDASREARAAIARARRGTFALVSIAALGIAVGIAGVSGYRPAIGVAGIPEAGADDVSAANTGPAGPTGLNVNDPGQSIASRFAALPTRPEDEGPHPASVAPTPAPTSENSGLDGAPADARVEVTQTANAKDETSNVPAPSRQQANTGYPPLPAAMGVPSGLPRLEDGYPASVNPDRVGPPTEYAEQRPISHRAHRHVRYTRYAYAPRPFDQFSRFLAVVHWRINSAFRE